MRHRLPGLTAIMLAAALLGATAAEASPFPLFPPSLTGDRATAAPAVAADKPAAPGVTVDGVTIQPTTADDSPHIVRAARWLSCVPFARALSGIDIYGDAVTWWNKAKGLYARFTTPRTGAVMVFAGSRHLRHGHVAVVKEVVSRREVRVDHANWGNDGKIYLNAPVVDVSPRNDWSEVRVWNVKLGVLGSHIYRISGFVAE